MADPIETPSFALIEGTLCRLNRRGSTNKRHRPLGTGISEFSIQGDRILVLEKAEGVLTGMPNLYCLDLELRLVWLAETNQPVLSAEFREGQVFCKLADGSDCLFEAANGNPLQVAG